MTIEKDVYDDVQIKFIMDMSKLYQDRADRLFEENIHLRRELQWKFNEIMELKETLAYFRGKDSKS